MSLVPYVTGLGYCGLENGFMVKKIGYSFSGQEDKSVPRQVKIIFSFVSYYYIA
jgi:hypothetical protein